MTSALLVTPARRSLALACGTALALAAMVGSTASAAHAADTGRAAATAVAAVEEGYPSTPATLGTRTLREVEDAAQSALERARDSVSDARVLVAEVASSGLEVASPTISTASLASRIDDLQDAEVTPLLLLPEVTAAAAAENDRLDAQIDQLRSRLSDAQAKKAAEEAAAKAAAEAAAAAQKAAEEAAAAQKAAEEAAAQQATEQRSAAPAPMGAVAPAGEAQAIAHDMVLARGWGEGEFSCLVSLWNRESGWNASAYNAGSGAYGIPQALPGNKMASAGADWQTNAATQISWGLGYISGRYGTPCGAWGHSQSTGWY
jgi:hypothetical protein